VFDQFFYYGSVFSTIWLLLELIKALGKGKETIHAPDKATQINTMDCAHEIAHILDIFDHIPGEAIVIQRQTWSFSDVSDHAAEKGGEEETVLQEQEVGFDIKEAKGNLAVAQ